jgi:hypothetical protein
MQPKPHRGRGKSKDSNQLAESAVTILTERETMSTFLSTWNKTISLHAAKHVDGGK